MNSYDIIREPVITERSMEQFFDRQGNEIHKYTFKVPVTANKVEIKKAVEEVFGVKVADVNTMIMKKKPARMGVHAGYKKAWKKAIVTLTEDSKTIEFFDGMI